nr:hypothetical protein [uncultured Chryseobacterium sp.]
MKKIIIFYCLCISALYCSQVGIGTQNPQAVFHVDGGKDNLGVGIPTSDQQANDFVVTSTGSVGIGNTNPQKSLDVDAKNESLRIRNLIRKSNDNQDVITRDITNGDISSTSYSYSVNTPTVPSGSSTTVSVPSTVDIPSGFLTIQSTNDCSRVMITNFVYSGLSLGYVSGVARDVIGNPSIAPIAPNVNSSGTWTVTFPNVTTCGSATGTQFDFSVIKTNTNSYVITNNGNVPKTYRMVISRL